MQGKLGRLVDTLTACSTSIDQISDPREGRSEQIMPNIIVFFFLFFDELTNGDLRYYPTSEDISQREGTKFVSNLAL